MDNILKSKLFVVEDDTFNNLVYLKHLKNLGFENVSTFESGIECLDHLIEKPDIILLDYQMEHLNGFETLKKIKRFDPSTFIIIISGQTSIDVAIASLKYGAFDYIKKGDGDLAKISSALMRIAVLKGEKEKTKPSFLTKIFN